MSEPVISVSKVSRSFGDVHAVQEISFEVLPGQIVGFIGANGAGKTTTMRMVATLEVPDSGTISVAGYDTLLNAGDVRRRLGWMPDHYGVYDHMTVFEYLDFFARAYGFKGEERTRRVNDVMEFADLTGLRARYIDTLSKGMGQRLCLGRALINDPSVLILDEPAAGLDPKARVEFKHLVRLLGEEGKAVFISSHILTELEDMCDTLLFINNGKIVHHGSSETLKRTSASGVLAIELKVQGELEPLERFLLEQPGVKVSESIRSGFKLEVTGHEESELAALLRRLVQGGFNVYEFRRVERRLEEAFIDIVGKGASEEGGHEQ